MKILFGFGILGLFFVGNTAMADMRCVSPSEVNIPRQCHICFRAGVAWPFYNCSGIAWYAFDMGGGDVSFCTRNEQVRDCHRTRPQLND